MNCTFPLQPPKMVHFMSPTTRRDPLMNSKSVFFSVLFAGLTLVSTSSAADFPKFEAQELDKHAGEVVYAVTTADVNGDKKPDVVAATEDAVYWYENPSWTKHTIIKGKTERDNVCIQPYDIDGDGQIDFALGAGWHPATTVQPSTLQWLGRDAKGEWQVHPIKYEQPTLHRLRFGDVLGTGKAQLVIAPLQGKGTKGPNWVDGQGVKIEVFSIPKDPTSPDWPSEVADDSLPPVAGETDSQLKPLIDEALKDRPEMLAFEQQVRAQQETISSVKGAYGPAISAQAGVSQGGEAIDNLAWNAYVGVNLAWNIFQGGLTNATVREAGANLRSIAAQSAGEAQQIASDVNIARLAVRAGLASQVAAQAVLKNSKSLLRLAEGQYQTGIGSIIQLSDAQVAESMAEAQVIQADFTLATARAQLLKALGRP